ncbi:MAG: hypothetical protein K8T25_08385 [Planctomycetia bacterium]|nr:hypothetical protein [Planctomycetia bacterium]
MRKSKLQKMIDGLPDEVVVRLQERSKAEKDAILKAGWKQIRKAQDRNRGVSAKVVEREIQAAVAYVRRQAQS